MSLPAAATFTNRQSGIDALGLGLMNMSDDEDDDNVAPSSKHVALATATAPTPRHHPHPQPPPRFAAPRPGYVIDPFADPRHQQSSPRHQQSSPRHQQPSPHHQQPSPHRQQSSPSPRHPPSPSSFLSSTPHPLQPPLTPIQPVFLIPKSPNSPSPNVKFTDPEKPILRGNAETTLLPRRGERGDDFWRRFSIVVKQENASSQKVSPWLRKTQDGDGRLSRWVWVIGIVLLCCIGLGAGLGYYYSHKSSSPPQAPTAIGGSANEAATAASSSSPAVTIEPNGATSALRHVSPTFTLNARNAPHSTPLAAAAAHNKRRHFHI